MSQAISVSENKCCRNLLLVAWIPSLIFEVIMNTDYITYAITFYVYTSWNNIPLYYPRGNNKIFILYTYLLMKLLQRILI